MIERETQSIFYVWNLDILLFQDVAYSKLFGLSCLIRSFPSDQDHNSIISS